ncbi:MAG: hypothetical protein N2Z76_04950 [Treponemataceae bacterium]|nr:hypothetical protein [Treponemataceae bacterium]
MKSPVHVILMMSLLHWGGFVVLVPAQSFDNSLAMVYVQHALREIEVGRWNEARFILEQGAAFGEASSDFNYLFALLLFKMGEPAGKVLIYLEKAQHIRQWTLYTAQEALLLHAQVWIRLRNYAAALNILRSLPSTADTLYFSCQALFLHGNSYEACSLLDQALQRYPRDVRFVYLATSRVNTQNPSPLERQIGERIYQRRRTLWELDPELLWRLVPFLSQRSEQTEALERYRAQQKRTAEALPVLVRHGTIDETIGIDQLFNNERIEKKVLEALGAALREERSRSLFVEKLRNFSGVITEDQDTDGWPEVQLTYTQGQLSLYSYDADQDGIPELVIWTDGGIPLKARLRYENKGTDELERKKPWLEGFSFSFSDKEQTWLELEWQPYPRIGQVKVENTFFITNPEEFQWAPLRFIPLMRTTSGQTFVYPSLEIPLPRITERSLWSFAVTILRPGKIMPGSWEQLEVQGGVIQRSTETYQGKVLRETFYERGLPVRETLDTDQDGRMESRKRYFYKSSLNEQLENRESLLESDFDGDGLYEYGEELFRDGKLVKTWDLDRNGDRETRYIETVQTGK